MIHLSEIKTADSAIYGHFAKMSPGPLLRFVHVGLGTRLHTTGDPNSESREPAVISSGQSER